MAVWLCGGLEEWRVSSEENMKDEEACACWLMLMLALPFVIFDDTISNNRSLGFIPFVLHSITFFHSVVG